MEKAKIKGLFVIIAGPSGVGKGTVIGMLKKVFPEAVYPISLTTRQIRPGEKGGVVYDFVSRDEFERGIAAGEFLEYAKVHNKEYYGTLKAPVLKALEEGKMLIRELDRQGVHQVMDILPKENLLTIFIYPKDLEVLKNRISRRGELPAEEIERRMQSAREEMADEAVFDFRVLNEEGKVEECFEEVKEIIEKRLRG